MYIPEEFKKTSIHNWRTEQDEDFYKDFKLTRNAAQTVQARKNT